MTNAEDSLLADECLRDNDIGDSSLSLSDDRYRKEPRRPGAAADGSSRRQAAVSPVPVVLLPRDTDLDAAALSSPIASKLHATKHAPVAGHPRYCQRQSSPSSSQAINSDNTSTYLKDSILSCR